mmetsp:Transcript_25133/g.50520  ORF Transcript_25133/g.50520 Transcript_25133/m.50520 type:complete len:99 (-) Transcript_25133:4-300(-)
MRRCDSTRRGDSTRREDAGEGARPGDGRMGGLMLGVAGKFAAVGSLKQSLSGAGNAACVTPDDDGCRGLALPRGAPRGMGGAPRGMGGGSPLAVIGGD